jgi:hypothetical protein
MKNLSKAALLLVVGTLSNAVMKAYCQGPTEYEVKAAFIYNFAKFVEWQPDAFMGHPQTIVIGIIGDDPFGDVLDQTVKDKLVNNKKLEIHRFKSNEPPVGCQILFICPSEKQNLSAILKKVQGQNVLLVGDMEGFARSGGIINLVMTDGKVHFEINMSAAERSGLKISSRMLKLAQIIKE